MCFFWNVTWVGLWTSEVSFCPDSVLPRSLAHLILCPVLAHSCEWDFLKQNCSGAKNQKSWASQLTREDKEDARDKGQYGPVGTDVSDVAQDEPNEHEEEADQRERRGRANHF